MSVLGAACEEVSDPPSRADCPPGPQAPLGASCSQQGLQCRYGYEPIECGGRTLVCLEGRFHEQEHTDPAASCGAPPSEHACGLGTWDCATEQIARTICSTRDCEVCVQEVDELGNPSAWVALENASRCDCPEPSVAPRRAP